MRFHVILFVITLVCAISTPAQTWIHPGTINNKAELDFLKQKIASGAEPWTSHLERMISIEGLSEAPTSEEIIDASAGENSRDNARRAYGNALAWYLTGKEVYAKQAIAILNAWSSLKSISSADQQKLLQGGWVGALLGPAADIMLGYPKWDPADIAKLRAMFRRAFYPVLITASTWNGNVDLTQIEALLSIAVFNEDGEKFSRGLDRLKTRVPKYFYLLSDPLPDSTTWSNPTKWMDGLTQESCRDNNHHAQFALSAAIGAAEIAWHQGIDLYTIYQDRFVKAIELMAIQSVSGNMQGVCKNNNTSTDVYDTWEIAYHHFHIRRGIDMPNTWNMITQKVRSAHNGPNSWNIFYETLTHANLPNAQ